MSPVTREHRAAALALCYSSPVPFEHRWVETGALAQDADNQSIQRLDRVARALAEAEGRSVTWVDCAERMPPPGDETVLMHFATTEVLTGAWDGEDWLHGDRVVPCRHVTHWMPIPALPGESDD